MSSETAKCKVCGAPAKRVVPYRQDGSCVELKCGALLLCALHLQRATTAHPELVYRIQE